MGSLKLEEKKFWVLVGEKLHLYSDKKEAIIGLRNILSKEPKATVAEINYIEQGEKGTFNVEGVSWKDIALGWIIEEEK